jgi:hypothetical protein
MKQLQRHNFYISKRKIYGKKTVNLSDILKHKD